MAAPDAPNVSGFKSGGLDWGFAFLKEFEVFSVRVEAKTLMQPPKSRVLGHSRACLSYQKLFSPWPLHHTHSVISCELRICPQLGVIRYTPTTRACTISQLLPQLRILLLQPFYLPFVENPQILFSVPCFVESLHTC
jgi:hypothetical protein